MRRVLVTGGAGFIGSHLCETLLAAGDEVTCVDNFYTGRRENVEHLKRHGAAFRLIEHDIIRSAFFDVDEVFNLACPASPRFYQANPIRTIKANSLGMINVLGLAKRTGARLVQASTSEVYGDPEIHPQVEDYRGAVNCFGPRACYDEGKRLAEALCYEYRQVHGVDVRVARIFNTYGPRMAEADGRVVSTFICQALRGQPITVYGTGQQSRSLCYVDDLVRGLIALMRVTPRPDQPINLGNPEEWTMLELAKIVIELTGSKSEIVFEPLPVDDPRRRRPDITQAAKILGWKPTKSPRDGVTETIASFRARIAEGGPV